MISFKAQSLGSVPGEGCVLAGAGTLMAYPKDAYPAGEYVAVKIVDGGPLTASFSDAQEGDTSRLLVLVDGALRLAFVVPADAKVGSKVSVEFESIAQEETEGFAADLPISSPIEPITPPVQVLELPFGIDQ